MKSASPSSSGKSVEQWCWTHPIAASLIAALFVLALPFLIGGTFWGARVDAEKAARLGDFVGGYFGTAAVIASVGFLGLGISRARASEAKLEFERKYFEMLRFHRENAAELILKEIRGRRIFIFLIRELRRARLIALDVARQTGQVLTKQDVLVFAYMGLYYGVGINSGRMLTRSLEKYEPSVVALFVKRLTAEQAANERARNAGRNSLPYKVFDGHQSRLGHYYRHLYQTVMFVHQSELAIDKYQFVKTIRAQLSNYEQALLLINSVTPLGVQWNSENILLEYKFVKNIPRHFFDVEEMDVEKMFPPGYFEWNEVNAASVQLKVL